MLAWLNPHYYYIILDVACILFPFLFSFRKVLPVYRQWKKIAAGTLLMMLIFIPWDAAFTVFDIWEFNDEYTIGIRFLHLPIEEWLFFICIPYACTFTYLCFKYFFPEQPFGNAHKYISLSLITICLVLAIFFWNHAYTSITSVVCATLIGLHVWKWKSNYMGWFYLSWSILLIPFFISNGILTGLHFWSYPFINTSPELVTDYIVGYNNQHNLGLRIWSVPADDFFYGLTMVLIVVTVLEKMTESEMLKRS